MRILLLFVLASAGCLRSTQFQCDTDQSCGAQGRCESTGFCSFPDGDCQSGRKYGDSAGTNAGKCTGDQGPGIDGGIDGMVVGTDGSVDGDGSKCPMSFASITGAGSHVYKVQANGANWAQQQNACRALSTNAYLAIPDDQNELNALDTASGQTLYWVGISDIATENTFVTVLNTPQLFLPWQPPAPDDAGPGEDCVEALVTVNKFNDERCNTTLPAICECDP
jgi:hypothetical protein